MALTQISTAGVKDDAVTAGKIPANAVGSSELADNAVDTAAIANDAVTSAKIADGTIIAGNLASNSVTSSQIANNVITDAKINPSAAIAKSKIQEFVNTNADNRIITGTGTTNTVQGEPQLTFDSSGLLRIQAPDNGIRYFFGETGNSQSAQLSLYDSSDSQKVRISAGNGDSFFTGGDLGIGTNAPSSRCHISDSDNTAWSTSNLSVGLRVQNSSTTNNSAAGLELRSFQNNGGASLQYLHAVNDGASSYGSDLVFTTRVAYTGAYRESCRITNAGNLKFPNGHGIDFGSSSNTGGMTNELLNDYEEGTFTPQMHDGNGSNTNLTVNSGACFYTKIGRLVNVSGIVTLNDTGKSGEMVLTHLPFNSAASHAQLACGSWWMDKGGPSADVTGAHIYKPANGASAYFVNPTGGSAGGGNANNRYFQFSEWQNGRPIYFNLTYMTA